MSIQTCRINIESDSESRRGTAFIINKNENYYMVTAKHCFLPTSKQQDYTMPSIEDSLYKVHIVDSNSIVSMHQELLIDSQNKTLLYHIYEPEKGKALDIAVLKLTDLNEKLKEQALPYSWLNDDEIDLTNGGIFLFGYPSKLINGYHSTEVLMFEKKDQDGLGDDGLYYFILKVEEDLKGISGCPIISIGDDNSKSIIGIFVGQNNKHKEVGYGIFSKYIKKAIDNAIA